MIGIQSCQQRRIISHINNDSHISMIFGGSADHRRPANVDILYALIIGRAFGNGSFEGIEIDHQ